MNILFNNVSLPFAISNSFFWILAAGLLFLTSAILMWLWNITIPRIFNFREITFWEAFRLIIIAGILFGGGFGINITG